VKAAATILFALCAARLSAQDSSRIAEVQSVLAPLIESYGVSGMEAPVRATVLKLLPAWVRAIRWSSSSPTWMRSATGSTRFWTMAH